MRYKREERYERLLAANTSGRLFRDFPLVISPSNAFVFDVRQP